VYPPELVAYYTLFLWDFSYEPDPVLLQGVKPDSIANLQPSDFS
jgi:hypothetical protein